MQERPCATRGDLKRPSSDHGRGKTTRTARLIRGGGIWMKKRAHPYAARAGLASQMTQAKWPAHRLQVRPPGRVAAPPDAWPTT